MPIYTYLHPKTKERFDIVRTISERNNPYIHIDGVKCQREEVPHSMGYCGLATKEREVFQVDRELVHKCKPKKIKFRDGHTEKFDPQKHC